MADLDWDKLYKDLKEMGELPSNKKILAVMPQRNTPAQLLPFTMGIYPVRDPIGEFITIHRAKSRPEASQFALKCDWSWKEILFDTPQVVPRCDPEMMEVRESLRFLEYWLATTQDPHDVEHHEFGGWSAKLLPSGNFSFQPLDLEQDLPW